MTPQDSWLLLLCVVIPVASLSGIAIWAAWKLGLMSGEKRICSLWLESTKADTEVDALKKQLEAAPHYNRVLTSAAAIQDDCKCGGLCPGCAVTNNETVLGIITCEKCGCGMVATCENWQCPECGNREDF